MEDFETDKLLSDFWHNCCLKYETKAELNNFENQIRQ